MPGKLCFGKPTNNAGAGNLSTSKSFCEGANYRASGSGVSKPSTDNPHASGSDDYDAWDAGWTIANAASPGIWDAAGSCCAPTVEVPA